MVKKERAIDGAPYPESLGRIRLSANQLVYVTFLAGFYPAAICLVGCSYVHYDCKYIQNSRQVWCVLSRPSFSSRCETWKQRDSPGEDLPIDPSQSPRRAFHVSAAPKEAPKEAPYDGFYVCKVFPLSCVALNVTKPRTRQPRSKQYIVCVCICKTVPQTPTQPRKECSNWALALRLIGGRQALGWLCMSAHDIIGPPEAAVQSKADACVSVGLGDPLTICVGGVPQVSVLVRVSQGIQYAIRCEPRRKQV